MKDVIQYPASFLCQVDHRRGFDLDFDVTIHEIQLLYIICLAKVPSSADTRSCIPRLFHGSR